MYRAKIFFDVLFITSVASYNHSVSGLRGTSSFPICFNYWYCFNLNSINYCFCCLKIWSNLEKLAWSLVLKWYSEDGVSEVRVTTSYPIVSDDNLFDVSFRYSLICFSYCAVVIMGAVVDRVFYLILTSSFKMILDENVVVVSLSTLVSYERQIVSDLRLTSSWIFLSTRSFCFQFCCQSVHFLLKCFVWSG